MFRPVTEDFIMKSRVSLYPHDMTFLYQKGKHYTSFADRQSEAQGLAVTGAGPRRFSSLLTLSQTLLRKHH